MLSRLSDRLFIFALVLFIVGGLVFNSSKSSAAILFNRSVVLSSVLPSAAASYDFEFDIPTSAVIGSIEFEYCSNSPDFYTSCIPPAGLDASAAVLLSQFGNTGFSIDTANSNASRIVLTRTPAAGSMVTSGYTFDNIINPSSAGPSTFVRISTYASVDGTGPSSDRGAVAFSIQNIFNVGAFVPPFLRLCVGITVAPDCSEMNGSSIDLGTLSSTQARFAQSQFATATNDPTGYVVFALGNTMTSGNNTIPAMPNQAASLPGTGQFGINLRANLIPGVGQDPVGLGTALPTANYNLPNRFMYLDGDSIATSPINSDYNRMTVSYLVNIPSSQPAGIYATTITYLALVQF